MFPVESVLDEIRRHLAANRDVVLSAPPGSGKTTCVPTALMDEEWLGGGKILMLEPRRLAARNCARYIAAKRGEKVGGSVGYQVRLERKVSAATRLEIVTEGLLTQRLLSDPELSGVGLVVFDEFHERSLACDTGFALAIEVRRALRPDLRLLVMSATLDADEVAAHLGDAAVVRAEGRMFPVETRYLGDMPLAGAVRRALAETDGDVLCFLPGEGEIRRAAATLGDIGAKVLPLYGALAKEEQDLVFERSSVRKVILATSIAETSVTIDGVTAVVDSGLMRVSRFSPATGMSGLVTLPLTMDRAEQRRGRAGRVRAGVCYRLWSETEDRSRPQKARPEIMDADLASLVLTSAAWGALGREDLPWMTPPPAAAWEQAAGLLKLLGATDGDGRLTGEGIRMASMPMHPRLANMLLGGGDPVMAAIVEEGVRSRESDIRFAPRTGRVKELARRFGAFAAAGAARMSEGEMLALAYPDRIAKNRGNGTFRMVNGRGAFLDRDDPMAKEPYIVCCELDDRQGDAKVFLGCPITEGEILSRFADRIVERPFCAWDRREDCVRCAVRGELGEMTIYEKTRRGGDGVREAVLEGVRIKGVANLPCWTAPAMQMRERIGFLRRHLGEAWPDVSDAAVIAALGGFVGGIMRWKELEKIDMTAVLDLMLAESGRERRELDRLAPVKMEVPSGSHMTIRYEGDEPTVQVRLQECFGLMETPKVAGGKVPVVMTLLSPAQRPVQVTKDLAGFWKGAYALVRKDMRGRYPKHYWPEDPFTAVATRRVRPK
ncbi:MAG: ATP-dependent helicase HrpB [Kiritimatiellae bacterium]|nr:ATP-dependent helicase HrpB [Kiritimatiellia bacterium]